jgi:hypothetical protein
MRHLCYKCKSLNGLEQAGLAFHILSIIGTGLTFILSFLAIFHRSNGLIMHVNVFVSYGGSTFQLGSTIIATIIVVTVSNAFNKFGSTLGLKAEIGVSGLVMSWFAWWFMFLASTYWDVVWFVEFRRTALKRKWRSEKEVGNYWGVLGEVRKNLRRPDKKGKGVEIGDEKGDILVGRIVSVPKGSSSARRKSGTGSTESLVGRGEVLPTKEDHIELYWKDTGGTS